MFPWIPPLDFTPLQSTTLSNICAEAFLAVTRPTANKSFTMLKCLLILAFAAMCAAQGGAPVPAPKPEDYAPSDSCTAKCKDTFVALADMLEKNQPNEMEAEPCGKCKVLELHTIELTSDLVSIAPDKADPEGMYYILPMCFRNITVDCENCKAKDMENGGSEEIGKYSGTWLKPVIEAQCMKKQWDGEDLAVLKAEVKTQLEKGMIEGNCYGAQTDNWEKTCNKAKDQNLFDGLFYAAVNGCFPAKSNDNIQKNKDEAAGKDNLLAKMMTCNKDD